MHEFARFRKKIASFEFTWNSNHTDILYVNQIYTKPLTEKKIIYMCMYIYICICFLYNLKQYGYKFLYNFKKYGYKMWLLVIKSRQENIKTFSISHNNHQNTCCQITYLECSTSLFQIEMNADECLLFSQWSKA